MRRKTRITALVLAMLLAIPAFLQLSVPTVSAATTKQKLEEAKKNHAQIKSEMAEVQSKINALGRDKKDALAKKNAIDDQIELKARVDVINALSAHADRAGLAEWIREVKDNVRHAFAVHGEPEKVAAMVELLQDEGVRNAVAPSPGQTYRFE